MAVFPDALNVGSIADMSPEVRLRELRRYGINPSSEFVNQYQAVDVVSLAEQVRIWVECPYWLLPEFLYIASLARADAKVTVCEYAFEGNMVNEIPVDQKECAEKWRRLVEGDAALRVVKDEQLVSVGEDYFDQSLLDAWEESGASTKEAVGKVFNAYAAASGASFPDDFLVHRLSELLVARPA